MYWPLKSAFREFWIWANPVTTFGEFCTRGKDYYVDEDNCDDDNDNDADDDDDEEGYVYDCDYDDAEDDDDEDDDKDEDDNEEDYVDDDSHSFNDSWHHDDSAYVK